MANEKRLIDAEKFLQWLVKRFKCVPLIGSCDNDSESVKLLLAQAPTVEAVEVVHGRWEYHGGDDDMNLYGFCSNCHANWDEDVMDKFNYCPNCGADMRGDGNG